MVVLSRAIIRSKLGRVLTAIRDSETRLMFSGYNPLWYKLFIWTLSAVLCGIAGALYVPQVGIINPSEMSPANSIEIAIWVAVGGRGTLLGPVFGAAIVNAAKSYFTQAYPEYWLFFLGLLFILVTLFLPKGVAGLPAMLRRRAARSSRRAVDPDARRAKERSGNERAAQRIRGDGRRRSEPGGHGPGWTSATGPSSTSTTSRSASTASRP